MAYRSTAQLAAENVRQYAQLFDKDGGDNVIYVGSAKPGSLTTGKFWQIYKVTYDASNDPTEIRFADGDSRFDKVWAGRAGYNYTFA